MEIHQRLNYTQSHSLSCTLVLTYILHFLQWPMKFTDNSFPNYSGHLSYLVSNFNRYKSNDFHKTGESYVFAIFQILHVYSQTLYRTSLTYRFSLHSSHKMGNTYKSSTHSDGLLQFSVKYQTTHNWCSDSPGQILAVFGDKKTLVSIYEFIKWVGNCLS